MYLPSLQAILHTHQYYFQQIKGYFQQFKGLKVQKYTRFLVYLYSNSTHYGSPLIYLNCMANIQVISVTGDYIKMY